MLSDKVNETLDKALAWMEQNGQAVGSAVRTFDRALEEAKRVLVRVNETHLIDHVQRAARSCANVAEHVNVTLDQLDQEEAWQHLAKTIRGAQGVTQTLNKTLCRVVQGEGTVGKLLVADDIYCQMKTFLDKLNATMGDINAYGLLFQLNKKWQRAHNYPAILHAFPCDLKRRLDNLETAVDGLSRRTVDMTNLLKKPASPVQKSQVPCASALEE